MLHDFTAPDLGQEDSLDTILSKMENDVFALSFNKQNNGYYNPNVARAHDFRLFVMTRKGAQELISYIPVMDTCANSAEPKEGMADVMQFLVTVNDKHRCMKEINPYAPSRYLTLADEISLLKIATCNKYLLGQAGFRTGLPSKKHFLVNPEPSMDPAVASILSAWSRPETQVIPMMQDTPAMRGFPRIELGVVLVLPDDEAMAATKEIVSDLSKLSRSPVGSMLFSAGFSSASVDPCSLIDIISAGIYYKQMSIAAQPTQNAEETK